MDNALGRGVDDKVAELIRIYPSRKNFAKVTDRQIGEIISSLKISDPKKKTEVTKDLNEIAQKKLDAFLADAFKKTFSEREMDYLLSLYRSSFGQRMNDLMGQVNNHVIEELRKDLRSEADHLSRTRAKAPGP